MNMTHIVDFPTKKAFKAAVEANASDVWLEDPAIVGACSGFIRWVLKQKGSITVTNHPKRSWFAAVSQVGDRIKIE
jgi:hypothetical protein